MWNLPGQQHLRRLTHSQGPQTLHHCAPPVEVHGDKTQHLCYLPDTRTTSIQGPEQSETVQHWNNCNNDTSVGVFRPRLYVKSSIRTSSMPRESLGRDAEVPGKTCTACASREAEGDTHCGYNGEASLLDSSVHTCPGSQSWGCEEVTKQTFSCSSPLHSPALLSTKAVRQSPAAPSGLVPSQYSSPHATDMKTLH